ncbi:MAG TPA: hypothetical protein VFI47_01055 [Acidimicrobiales bacterium]|nr:hypothetical protein [Acidimicrobiales bacterium]
MRQRVGIAAVVVLVVAAVAGLVAYGLGVFDGDDEPAAPDLVDSPATTDPVPTAVPAFCDGMAALDAAVAQAPDDPAVFPAFVTDTLTPTVATVRGAVPDQIAPEVERLLTAVEASAAGDDSGFDDPAYAAAQGEVYPYVAAACGYPQLDVTAVDHAFEGVPAQVGPGRTVVILHNESKAGEYHEMALVKLLPEATLPLADFLALPDEAATALIDPTSFGLGVYAPPGEVGASVVELTPGRWVYACFVPGGTTQAGVEGTGPPHAAEGMSGELMVG